MISSAIRIVSKAMCLLLIASFAMFAIDEFTTASSQQLAIAQGTEGEFVVLRDAHAREVKAHRNDLRGRIDRANDSALAPIEDFVKGQNPWIQRGVPFLLGLMLFGLGGHRLAAWLTAAPKGGAGPNPADQQLRPNFTPGYR